MKISKKLPKISFDFDDTLSRKDIQLFVKVLQLSRLVDIWIITSRYDDDTASRVYRRDNINDELWDVASRLNIPKSKVIFTNMRNKFYYISTGNFLFHLDNDFEELDLINRYTLCKGISCFKSGNWLQKCMKLIKEA